MALLCYNRGCGQRFDSATNTEGERGLYLPSLPRTVGTRERGLQSPWCAGRGSELFGAMGFGSQSLSGGKAAWRVLMRGVGVVVESCWVKVSSSLPVADCVGGEKI